MKGSSSATATSNDATVVDNSCTVVADAFNEIPSVIAVTTYWAVVIAIVDIVFLVSTHNV